MLLFSAHPARWGSAGLMLAFENRAGDDAHSTSPSNTAETWRDYRQQEKLTRSYGIACSELVP